jgi:hypothetical protein
MASKPVEPAEPSKEGDTPLDHDEKVKIDLPFGTALRALLKTPPRKPESRQARPRREAT